MLCSGRRYFPYYSYSRNPTGREFFVPAQTHRGIPVNASVKPFNSTLLHISPVTLPNL
jgi:hypothetical protein